jgi:hypothetical protein
MEDINSSRYLSFENRIIAWSPCYDMYAST